MPQQDGELTRLAKVATFCWQLQLISCTDCTDHWYHVSPSLFSFAANWISLPQNLLWESMFALLFSAAGTFHHPTEWRKHNVLEVGGEKKNSREGLFMRRHRHSCSVATKQATRLLAFIINSPRTPSGAKIHRRIKTFNCTAELSLLVWEITSNSEPYTFKICWKVVTDWTRFYLTNQQDRRIKIPTAQVQCDEFMPYCLTDTSSPLCMAFGGISATNSNIQGNTPNNTHNTSSQLHTRCHMTAPVTNWAVIQL